MGIRSQARAWLILSRLSNLPTVWTNVLAGGVVAGATADGRLAGAAVAISILYVGGMLLNDVCDADHDRVHRRSRPIPAGIVRRTAAAGAAAVCMLAGLAFLYMVAHNIAAIGWTLALIAAITYYDFRHKTNAMAPVVMGVCRGLVYVVSAATVAGVVPSPVWPAATVLTVYVAVFTVAARRAPIVRPWVPWCIAGISMLDAGVLAWAEAPRLALAAVAGVPLTLLLQRWVPGD